MNATARIVAALASGIALLVLIWPPVAHPSLIICAAALFGGTFVWSETGSRK